MLYWADINQVMHRMRLALACLPCRPWEIVGERPKIQNPIAPKAYFHSWLKISVRSKPHPHQPNNALERAEIICLTAGSAHQHFGSLPLLILSPTLHSSRSSLSLYKSDEPLEYVCAIWTRSTLQVKTGIVNVSDDLERGQRTGDRHTECRLS